METLDCADELEEDADGQHPHAEFAQVTKGLAPHEHGELIDREATHQQQRPEGIVKATFAGLIEERQRLDLEEVRQREHGEAEEVDQHERAENKPLASAAELRWWGRRELALSAPRKDEGDDGDARGDDETQRKLDGIIHMNDGDGEPNVDEADGAAEDDGVSPGAPEVETCHQQPKRQGEDDRADDIAGERRERAAFWNSHLTRALHPYLVGIGAVDEIDDWIRDSPDHQQRHGDVTDQADDAMQVRGGHEPLPVGDHDG